ncbi:MAG TPA: hypothetical protein VN279_07740, partial [Rhodocyclaceae bacterium]|nr:hypothetical protein [Rhodocyclaceae bacterium]
IPFGFLMGYGICAAVAAAINATQETFRMPLVLSTHTFAFAFVVVAAAAFASGLLVWGRLRRLDLVAVLKTRIGSGMKASTTATATAAASAR